MLIKPDIARFAKIKVIGIGGGGCNAISSMITLNQINGVDFLGVNCDAQALLTCQAQTKIQIGENLTRGLGAGGNLDIGRQAAEESKEKLKEFLRDTDMVFFDVRRRRRHRDGCHPRSSRNWPKKWERSRWPS